MPHDTASAVGAAAFWAFVAVCVIAGVANSVMRNREAQKTIRLAIEKGQTLDPETLERLLQGNRPASASTPQARFGLLTGGLAMLSIGIGFGLMGWFVHLAQPGALYPMIGVACLIGMIGVGLLIASAFAPKGGGAKGG